MVGKTTVFTIFTKNGEVTGVVCQRGLENHWNGETFGNRALTYQKKKTKKYTVMKKVKCVKCGTEVEINIANAVDFNGEVYVCPECGYKFRFVDK